MFACVGAWVRVVNTQKNRCALRPGRCLVILYFRASRLCSSDSTTACRYSWTSARARRQCCLQLTWPDVASTSLKSIGSCSSIVLRYAQNCLTPPHTHTYASNLTHIARSADIDDCTNWKHILLFVFVRVSLWFCLCLHLRLCLFLRVHEFASVCVCGVCLGVSGGVGGGCTGNRT